MEKHINLPGNPDEGTSNIFSKAPETPKRKWRFINLNYLNAVAPGNKYFFVEMMTIFKSESVSSLVRMEKQLSGNDLFGFGKTAHALKPGGAYMGVNSLTTLIGNLEQMAVSGNINEVNTLFQQVQQMVAGVNLEIDEYLRTIE